MSDIRSTLRLPASHPLIKALEVTTGPKRLHTTGKSEARAALGMLLDQVLLGLEEPLSGDQIAALSDPLQAESLAGRRATRELIYGLAVLAHEHLKVPWMAIFGETTVPTEDPKIAEARDAVVLSGKLANFLKPADWVDGSDADGSEIVFVCPPSIDQDTG